MPRFLIEVPHDADVRACTRAVEVLLRTGSHFLTHADWGCKDNEHKAFRSIRVPKAHPFVSPLLYAVPVQLLAYHAAVFIGTDVDQPRNLAKSVTVE